jgi:hypothetical protein
MYFKVTQSPTLTGEAGSDLSAAEVHSFVYDVLP